MFKNNKTRIMVFGTFDVLHKGHLNFFKQARRLAKNPFLVVSIGRDVNVKKIKNRGPRFSEKLRLKKIKNLALVDKVTLGGIKNHLPHILKERPKIIALGYDQKEYVVGLKLALNKRGLKVSIKRLKPFKPKTYKSSLVKTVL